MEWEAETEAFESIAAYLQLRGVRWQRRFEGDPGVLGTTIRISRTDPSLLVEVQLAPVCPVQTDDDRGPPVEPPTDGLARDAEIRREGHVTGPADEIPEPVVIALLRAGPARHADDHPPFGCTAQLLGEDAERPPASGQTDCVTTTRAPQSRMSVGTAPRPTLETVAMDTEQPKPLPLLE
jgi:hypothetical protein